MNTFEIGKELKQFKNAKVFSRDNLPEKVKIPSAFVINTDSSKEPGEHWVAIYVGAEEIPIYFDSFGLPPLHEDLIAFLKRVGKGKWRYNLLTLQHPESKSCGMYCIEFLKSQYYKRSLKSFQNIFTSDLILNEKVLNTLRYRKRNG